MNVSEYVRSLDEALVAYMNGDADKMKAHKAKYAVPTSPDPLVERMSILKAVTAKVTLPMELRSKAKAELARSGFKSIDDGDVP